MSSSAPNKSILNKRKLSPTMWEIDSEQITLTVILDANLQPQNVPAKRISVKSQPRLDLTNQDHHYSQYEYTDDLIDESKTQNHLVNAFLFAYNHHLPLKLRVDDIKLCLQTAIATCINNQPERYRSLFVDHKGKRELRVQNLDFNPDFFCQTFAQLMKANLKNPEFAKHFSAPYSTTTQIAQTVSNLSLMNTLKEFFSYEMVLGCGIPEVQLEGTQQDWQQLNTDYQYLKTFLKDSELASWFGHFDILMSMFMEMRNLGTSGQVEASSDIKELWKRVVAYVPQGSGGQRILGGWVRLLIPYASGKHLIGGLDKPVLCLDITQTNPSAGAKNGGYGLQSTLKAFYLASGWSSVQNSVVDTPATLVDGAGTTHSVEFHSGFFPAHFDGKVVCTNMGYNLTQNLTEKLEQEKEAFIAQGVKMDSRGLDVQIPRVLRHQIERIEELFHAHGYNFYGVDPEEESQKQAYRDKGVVADQSGRELTIPTALKEEESAIRELFETNHYTQTTYI